MDYDGLVDASREAQRLLETAWGNRFPVDPVQVARDLGADVVELELEEGISGAVYKAPGEDPTIIMNESDSTNRKRFTAAHELGHLIQHSGQDTLDFVDYRHTPSNDLENTDYAEVFADEFAGALLMPEREVKRLLTRPYRAAYSRVFPMKRGLDGWSSSAQFLSASSAYFSRNRLKARSRKISG